MRGAFLFPRVVGVLVLAAVLSIGLVLVALINDEAAFYGALPVMWLLVLGPSLAGAWVAYRKEHYEIHGEHLLARRGGLLSDGVTELDIKNITHVKLRLPWLRHKFFKIGDVRVESAGSAASEITFQSVLEPEAIYQQLQSLMRDNGYALNRGQVLHQESPTFIGAITDVVQTAIGLLFTLLGIAVFAWAGAAEAVDGPAGALITGGGVVLTLGSALLGIGGLGVRYLDLTRRTYTVYADTVEYTEGFLTRDNAFIPYENIADAATNRTFVDQILGLYDVSVSCQGSGSEIKFRRLSNGPALKGAISTLVANARTLEKPRDRKARPGEGGATAAGAAPVAGRRTAAKVAPADAWTAELQMDAGRALAPLVVTLPMLPIFLLASVGQAIVALRTRYSIGPDSMSREFSFIGSQSQSFAYDKVTGVQVNRSFIDGFFKTMTVQIWSIGAPQPLTLLHVKEKDVDLVRLLRQCGIDSAEPVEGELQQSFGFKVWAIQNLGFLVFLALAVLALVPAAVMVSPFVLLALPVLALLPVPAAVLTRMRTDRQRVTFHATHLECQTGILFRQHVYAPYEHIKKVESVSIPFTNQGRFKVYVAGERKVQAQNNQAQAQGGAAIPYSLQGEYLEDIASKVDAMDALLLGRIEPPQILGYHPQGADLIVTSKPAVANSVVPLVVFFPLIWLAPLVAWRVRVTHYDVESDRVVERSGILFKRAVSVLFDRIDSLQQSQGALGKMFGNGTVTLMTAGSSNPDLNIANLPDYTQVYATIRKNYGGSA